MVQNYSGTDTRPYNRNGEADQDILPRHLPVVDKFVINQLPSLFTSDALLPVKIFGISSALHFFGDQSIVRHTFS
ncbi:MAG: hypothetical protein U5K69_28360 [Balneolaceae bacterium]|nr:hypothetical protein [Balneolaceae bacterium]